MEDNIIVCRCSDVTLSQVRRLILEGYTSFDEIKRITRSGMGPCRGKTCGPIIMREIALATGSRISELENQTCRPPITGVRLELIAEEAEKDERNG